jgi:apolipoprotein N-acyltransferase
MTGRRRALLYAAAAGGVSGILWLPFGLAPLLPLSFVLAMRGLRSCDGLRDAALFGLVFGAMRYAIAGHFLLALLRYSPLAIVLYLLGIAFILPMALMESTGAVWLERRVGLPRTVGFALLYAFGEVLRTLGDLSFPADLVPHAFGVAPAWLAWSRWAGPFSVTLLVLLTAVALDAAIAKRRRPRLALGLGALAAAAWLGPPLTDLAVPPPGGLRATDKAGPALRVALVQPCVRVEDKADPRRISGQWSKLERMTAAAADAGADLVVWPETARPMPLVWRDGTPLHDPEMASLSRRTGVPILYGTEIVRLRGRQLLNLYNGAALVHPDDRPVQWYAKQRLLPFVEAIPFADLLGIEREPLTPGERSLLTLVGRFTAGTRPTLFEVGPARIGVLVCYEGLYPHLGRRYRRAGANALCVLTNDGWWGRSIFPRWHAQMVAARARETGVPVIRAANTGVSSSTSAGGELEHATEVDRVTQVVVPLRPATGPATLYARTGDVVAWLLGLTVVAATLLALTPARYRPWVRPTLGDRSTRPTAPDRHAPRARQPAR